MGGGGGAGSQDYRPRLYIQLHNVTRNGFSIRLQINLHLAKLQMQDMAWIGLVFLFLQLLLASCSEGESVVEQRATLVSTV